MYNTILMDDCEEEYMAIRNIRTLGDDILRAKAKEITEMTPRIEELIDDMFDTMYEANGVGLAAVSSADCSVIYLDYLALVYAVGYAFLKHVLLGADGSVAVGNLEVVDAAEGSVIEQHYVDLVAHLNRGDQLRVQHVEGTVAAHSVNFLIRASDLSAQSGSNLVTHAGVTVLHVVGVLLAGTPQTLHVARQRACCSTYDSVVIDHVVDGAQNGGLAQLAAGILDVLLNALTVVVVALRGEVLLVGVLKPYPDAQPQSTTPCAEQQLPQRKPCRCGSRS